MNTRRSRTPLLLVVHGTLFTCFWASSYSFAFNDEFPSRRWPTASIQFTIDGARFPNYETQTAIENGISSWDRSVLRGTAFTTGWVISDTTLSRLTYDGVNSITSGGAPTGALGYTLKWYLTNKPSEYVETGRPRRASDLDQRVVSAPNLHRW